MPRFALSLASLLLLGQAACAPAVAPAPTPGAPAQIEFRGVKAEKVSGVATFVLMDVEDFRTLHSDPVADLRLQRVERREF